MVTDALNKKTPREKAIVGIAVQSRFQNDLAWLELDLQLLRRTLVSCLGILPGLLDEVQKKQGTCLNLRELDGRMPHGEAPQFFNGIEGV